MNYDLSIHLHLLVSVSCKGIVRGLSDTSLLAYLICAKTWMDPEGGGGTGIF